MIIFIKCFWSRDSKVWQKFLNKDLFIISLICYHLLKGTFWELLTSKEGGLERRIQTYNKIRGFCLIHLFFSLWNCSFLVSILLKCCLHVEKVIQNQKNDEQKSTQNFLYQTSLNHFVTVTVGWKSLWILYSQLSEA